MTQRTVFAVGRRLTQCPPSTAASPRECKRLISSTSSRATINPSGALYKRRFASLCPFGAQKYSLSQGLLRRQTRTSPSLPRLSPFSTTAVNYATKVSLNPRDDDDGKPMLIEISARAAKRLRELTAPSSSKSSLSSNSEPYDHLRVTVTSGGCHGFQYLMSLDPSSKIDPEEDTVFEEDSPDAKSPAGGEAKVVMDSASLELLKGSTIDYTIELIGSQFKVVNNPRASSSCGCGTSFDVNE